jgi:Fic family protein
MSQYEEILGLWYNYNVKTEADIDLRLHNFRILFAYNSGKIENDAVTYSDTREIFANGRVLNYTGSPRTLFELSNQRVCYEFLKPKLAAKEPLSITLIKETHGVLTGGAMRIGVNAPASSKSMIM